MPTDQTITYNGLELFSSGPGRIEPGEVAARDAVTQTPGTVGATVVGQGIEPRTIVQRGELIADTEPGLQALARLIEEQVGQGEATLVDEQGNAWDGCVMRSYTPGGIEMLGPRVSINYTIQYLQTRP